MIEFGNYKGRLIKMMEPYPIYDRDDDEKVIGYTEIGDMAVVTYSAPLESYHEVIIVSGKYTGVDSLALNNVDIANSVFILNSIDDYGIVRVRGNDVKYKYV